MSTIRARFDGRVLVPVDPVNLPTDRLLELEVRDATPPGRGSPQLIRQLMHAAPHIPPDDVDALERAIDEGQTADQPGGIFDDLLDTGGA